MKAFTEITEDSVAEWAVDSMYTDELSSRELEPEEELICAIIRQAMLDGDEQWIFSDAAQVTSTGRPYPNFRDMCNLVGLDAQEIRAFYRRGRLKNKFNNKVDK